MPTPTGLPKPGEVWERTLRLPPDWRPETVRFKVLARGTGSYWSLTVDAGKGRQMWVDASYWLSQGELRYVGQDGEVSLQAQERLSWEQQSYQEVGKAGKLTLFAISWHTVTSRPDWKMTSTLPGLNGRDRSWEASDKDRLKAQAERLLATWLKEVGA